MPLYQQSRTKKTILQLLQQQIKLLHVDAIQMNEDALIKQLAKRKVIYNMSKKNQIQLVYSYIALSQYYLTKKYHDAAMKNLLESVNIIQTGDALFFMGQIQYERNQYKKAVQYLQTSLQIQWIEPSFQHKIANRLQCMTILQKIYFEIKKKEKLLELAEMKVKETLKQKGYKNKTENYFLALSLADYALIQQKFQNYQTSLERITQAINLLERSSEDPGKLLDCYLIKAGIFHKIYLKNTDSNENYQLKSFKKQQKQVLQKGVNLIEMDQKMIPEAKQVEILQKLIQVNLFF